MIIENIPAKEALPQLAEPEKKYAGKLNAETTLFKKCWALESRLEKLEKEVAELRNSDVHP